MDGGLRDWLAGLSRRELTLFVLLGVAAVAGAGLWYVRSLPTPVEVRAGPPAPAVSTSPEPLFIHVAAARIAALAPDLNRVIDAIDLAGGPRRGAELSALNLAATLTDGQQVLVPGPAPPAGSGAAPTVPGATPGSTLVNVNLATAEELETLPGIGEVLAEAIISYREEHGPFGTVDELEDVSGIGPVTLEEIRDLVTV